MCYALSITIIFACNFLISCSTSCDSEIIGKYVNKYRADEVKFIEIYSDSTYRHYYKNSENEIKSATGKWKFFKNKCELILTNWYYYDDLFNKNWQPNIVFVRIRGGEIEFLADSRTRFSYFKE